ncbi:MAG: M3 family metallopeptidase [Akkermansia sp.]
MSSLRSSLLLLCLSSLTLAQDTSSVPAPDPLPDTCPLSCGAEPNDASPGLSISLNNRQSLPCWSVFTPDDAVIQLEDQIRKAKATIELICALQPDEMRYENTFARMEALRSSVDLSQMMLVNFCNLMDSPEVRAAREKTDKLANEFGAWVSGNKQLWQAIQRAAHQPWVKQLSPAKQRYIQQSLDSYIDSGANLSPKDKAEFDQLVTDLSLLRQRFSKNVLDGKNAAALLITNEAELAGMSPEWKALAAQKALAAGHGTEQAPEWLVTMDYSSYLNILRNCDVAATRQKVWQASEDVGFTPPYDNAGIVYQILEKRQRMAHLLGYKTYVDAAAAHRMIGNCDNVRTFVDEMMAKVKPAWQKEMSDFLAFISEKKGKKSDKLNPWDMSYYMNLLSQERYQFDQEQMRPYLEHDRVLRCMLDIASELYNVTITERPTQCPDQEADIDPALVNVWHPEVRFFDITDNKSGQLIAQFYYDPFPRSTKNGGAWVQGLRQAGAGDGPQLSVMVCNSTPSIGDKPSLMSFDEVVTLYHEFGHMLHASLTNAELESHAGTNVAWDFVEMPSQYNEHFAWERDNLKRYAKHYQTGEVIPDDLLNKFLAARYFLPARENMAQFCLAKLDMEMHSRYDELFKGKDIDTSTAETLKEWTVPMSVPRRSIMRCLTHCMSGGYSGAYYSYKWAEVLAADGYTRMKKEGIHNKATGASFRETILGAGDSIPAADAYRNFMGREPNSDALLEEQGLLNCEPSSH